ncbi:MAG: hypothetical protein LBF69_03135, partial [Prevotellaceae bacterium]|nr:hypothetical protein [Prevotellaceae bacterium]
LHFRVDNGAGFPIRLSIDEVVSIASGQSQKMAKVDSVDILANKSSSERYLSSKCKFGGEKLGEVLSNMPSEVEFKFSATINPEGNKNGAVKNFLTDAGTITVSNIEARVPLNFSVTNMTLRDTLDFNSSKLTFKDMKLLLNVKNSMPVAVGLQAYMIDENGNINSDPLFKDPVSIEAATVDADGIVVEPNLYEDRIETNVEGLAQTKKLKVEISVNTDNSQYVRVTKDNYVHIKIGAKAVVNVNNLD